MDDDWKKLKSELSRKRGAARKRRQLEVIVRSDAMKEMYQNLTEAVVKLYKDNRNGLNSWEHFRAAATKLAEMHRFVNLTITRLYELGATEGAADYSEEFYEKVHDIWACSRNQNISYSFLQDYLSRPGDPPPNPLRRAKRLTNRRFLSPRLKNRVKTPSLSSSFDPIHLPSSTTNISEDDRPGALTSSTGSHMDSVPMNCDTSWNEDNSWSGSSCSCENDCTTDTSTSSNSEDDGSHTPPGRFISESPNPLLP